MSESICLIIKNVYFPKNECITQLHKNGHNFTCDQCFFMKFTLLDSAHIGLSIYAKNSIFMKNCKWSIFSTIIAGKKFGGLGPNLIPANNISGYNVITVYSCIGYMMSVICTIIQNPVFSAFSFFRTGMSFSCSRFSSGWRRGQSSHSTLPKSRPQGHSLM